MKKLITVLLTVLFLTSCAAMQKAPVDEIEKQIDTVTIVCNSAKMLSDAGLNVPGVEQCEKIVPQLTRDEVETILDILKCAQDNEPTSKEFGLCAVDKGWESVRDKIESLTGK